MRLSDTERETCREMADMLCDAFPWRASDEGAKYWHSVRSNLRRYSEREERRSTKRRSTD